MGKLMRASMVLFALAAALSLGALATLWFAWDPLLPLVAWVARMGWFNAALLALLAITAAGIVALLVTAVAMPGRRAGLVLAQESGRVTITKDALRSTVAQVIESHDALSCKRAQVRITGRRDPRIRIKAKVDPATSANLSTLGLALQHEVAERVGAFAGYPVQTVDITFAKGTGAVNYGDDPEGQAAASQGASERRATAASDMPEKHVAATRSTSPGSPSMPATASSATAAATTAS